MKENTVILPTIVNLSHGDHIDVDGYLMGSKNESLKPFDKYLLNKKCSTQYHHDPGLSQTLEGSNTLKRTFNSAFDLKANNNNSTDNTKRRNYSSQYSGDSVPDKNAILQMISNGNPSVINKIHQISTSNVKKIMDLLNKATSIRNFQTQLQSLILDMCIDMYTDKSNEQTISNLKSRVNYLSDEKALLSNVIKSQYESIKKLKQDELKVTKSEQEKQELKAELGRLKQFVNNLIYKDDHPNKNVLNDFNNRKPPDVY